MRRMLPLLVSVLTVWMVLVGLARAGEPQGSAAIPGLESLPPEDRARAGESGALEAALARRAATDQGGGRAVEADVSGRAAAGA
jgi:hypothetical protein